MPQSNVYPFKKACFSEGKGLSDLVEQHLKTYFAAHENGIPPRGVYETILREVEKPLLIIALRSVNWNQCKAADLLGLNRNTLRKKIKLLNIDIAKLKA